MDTTHTTRTLVISGVIVAVLAFGLGLWIQSRSDDSEDTPTPTLTPTVSASASPTATRQRITHIVHLGTKAFSPATLTVLSGDVVTFVNDTDTQMWPASDPHPTHTLCPGFDAKRPLNKGDTYTITFNTVRTCTYHNHLDPLNTVQRGTIVVQ